MLRFSFQFAMQRWVFLLWFMGSFGSLFAQNQPRPSSYGQWLMYFGDNKINDKWGIHSEAQFRNYLVKETLEQTLLRAGINHYASQRVMLTAGYAYIYTEPTDDYESGSTMREHRIWQQLILRHRAQAIFLEHRYRLEQRFVENVTNESSLFEQRIRYRFQMIFPFYSFSPHLRHWFLSSYNELFINLGREASGEYFDRNRLYFALGYQVSPKLNFQVGYLNQVINLPADVKPEVNHNLQIALFLNMDDLMRNVFTQPAR